jgi:hypothetical protein
MKQSSSTSSLADLNPDDPICFICLESYDIEKGEALVNSSVLRTCGCKFDVHPKCWNNWMKDKTDYDCPICRRQSVYSNSLPSPAMIIASRTPIPVNYGVRSIAFILILTILVVGIYMVVNRP